MQTVQLQHLKIGNVDIGFPIVQAALSGYSDWPMRVIARRLGAPYTAVSYTHLTLPTTPYV